ncbi:MAG: gliding motility protein GldL [Bacteroidaceae bacterium]|nr:gliding motility protein GldL [Bacteroidaceae bacterium]
MSRFSLIARLQHWMDSVPGQTFMNYAYSWGAAVVILGTLFKLTHIPGANLMLFIGMGTEVFVFFISGFDRPFDAKADTELADDFVTLDELEELKEAASRAANIDGAPQVVPVGGTVVAGGPVSAGATVAAEGAVSSGTVVGGGGGTVIIGGGAAPAGGTVVIGGGAPVAGEGTTVVAGGGGVVGGAGLSAEDAANLAAAAQAAASAAHIGQDAQGLLTNAQAANAPEVEDAIEAYVDQLQQLTEVLTRVREQASRMTQDSEEMVNLNRTLTGINTIYEMQLKSVSQQVGTIDQINDQTRRMASQIEELNGVYARMIEALTVNMPKAAPQA